LVIMLTEIFYNDTKTPMLNVLLKDARYAYTEIIACRENISALSLRELRKYVENITEKRIGLRAAYNDNPITVEINVTKDELSIRIISRFRNLELEKDILDKLLALNIEKIEIIHGVQEKLVGKKMYKQILKKIRIFLKNLIKEKILVLPKNIDSDSWIDGLILKLKESYSPLYISLMYSHADKKWVATEYVFEIGKSTITSLEASGQSNERSLEESVYKGRRPSLNIINILVPFVVALILSCLAYYITKSKLEIEE